MRAREADRTGVALSGDIEIGYEVTGDGGTTILLMPTWTIVHSRVWKMQVPHLARHFRVVTYDGPGNGRSDRTVDVEPYRDDAQAAHALAVMDATGTDRAVLVSLSKGARWSLRLAANHPHRVVGQVFIGASLPLTPQAPDRAMVARRFLERLDRYEGWDKYNAHHWKADLADFAEFFFSQCFSEPHSTKPREDCVGWAMETTADILRAESATDSIDRDVVLAWCRGVDTPVLVIHGSDDRVSPVSRGEALAKATGGNLAILSDSGHVPLARDPVKVNRLIENFVREIASRSEARA